MWVPMPASVGEGALSLLLRLAQRSKDSWATCRGRSMPAEPWVSRRTAQQAEP